jgi:type IX secretion system PorP/SprF family membrane protein
VLNASLINPAAVGKDEALDLTLYTRKQWAGFAGTPFTSYFSANAMIKKPSVNFGLIIQDDRIGVSTTQNILAAYAYRLKLRKLKIAFGIQAGVEFLNNNLNKLNRVTGTDGVVDQNQSKQINFVTGAGIYVHNKKLFGGLSIPYLFNAKKTFNINTTPLLLNFGMIFNVNQNDIIKPSFLIRRLQNSQITADINLTYYINSKFGIGVSYRSTKAFVLTLEAILTEQFKVSYSYDYTTSALSKYQNGSHELSLRYLFGKRYNMNNPRALAY